MKLGDGRYDVGRALGVGGSGNVHEAFDRERGVSVALKLLREPSAAGLARFKREFRAMRGIKHPNLVTLGELREEDGAWFITMELVDGTDFLGYTGTAVPHAEHEPATLPHGAPTESPARHEAPPLLDVKRVRDAFAQLASGLVALHEAGVVHRDIKPSNVRVSPEGRVVILDFGLAHPIHARLDREERLAGTPAYMAPEQAAGGAVDGRADWYAVGTLLYQVLTGRLPFAGSDADILYNKCLFAPPPPSALVAGVPPDLEELCIALLQPRLESRPSDDVVAARLGIAPERRAVIPVTPTRLIGRERELAILRDRFVERQRNGPAAVCVCGESGIGKTALLRAFVDDVTASGEAWSLVGRCQERESVPFKGFDGVIDELASYLASDPSAIALDDDERTALLVQAFPVLRRVPGMASTLDASPTFERRETLVRVVAAARWLLAEVSRRRTLVIVIDDLQWADRDTMALVRAVLDQPLPGVLLVFGLRDSEPVDALLDAMERVELGPLSLEDTTGVVRSILERLEGHPVDVEPLMLAREAHGHPLFAIELARHAVVTGRRGSDPISLSDAVGGIVDRFGGAAKAILEIVCIAHTPIGVEPLAAAAVAVGAGFFDALSLLVTAQLVSTTGVGDAERIEPYHDRIRQAVIADLAPASRRAVHLEIATSLEAWPHADAEALALHWEAAGNPVAAAGHALRAADQARSALAYHRAARLYRSTLELAPQAVDAPRVLERCAEALAQAGLGVAAADAFLACARQAQGLVAVDLRRKAVQQLLLLGHVGRASALLDELMQELALSNPKTSRQMLRGIVMRRARIRLRRLRLTARPAGEMRPIDAARVDLLWDATAGLSLFEPLRSHYFQSAHFDMALRVGDTSRIARAFLAEAPSLAVAGRKTRRLERVLSLAEQAAEELGLPGMAQVARGVAATLLGNWREAVERLSEAEQFLVRSRHARIVTEGLGPTHLLNIARTMALGPRLHLGEIDDLARRTSDMLRDAVERNDIVAATHFRTGTQALMWLARGDVDQATRGADDGIRPWLQWRGNVPHFMDTQARAAIDLYTGRGASAHPRIVEAWHELAATFVLRAQYLRASLLDLRGRAAVAAAMEASRNERQRALHDAMRCARRLHAERTNWAVSLGAALSARIAEANGPSTTDDAKRFLARAIAGFEASQMKLHAEAARLRAATLAGDSAAVARAQRALTDAGVAEPARVIQMFG